MTGTACDRCKHPRAPQDLTLCHDKGARLRQCTDGAACLSNIEADQATGRAELRVSNLASWGPREDHVYRMLWALQRDYPFVDFDDLVQQNTSCRCISSHFTHKEVLGHYFSYDPVGRKWRLNSKLQR